MLKQVPIGEYAGLSTWAAFKYMAKHEGFYGFMKGNGVNVIRIAPFSAFEFYFYELYKN
jgi:solute carrier family 25 phosphate transporter 23/24/25/41